MHNYVRRQMGAVSARFRDKLSICLHLFPDTPFSFRAMGLILTLGTYTFTQQALHTLYILVECYVLYMYIWDRHLEEVLVFLCSSIQLSSGDFSSSCVASWVSILLLVRKQIEWQRVLWFRVSVRSCCRTVIMYSGCQWCWWIRSCVAVAVDRFVDFCWSITEVLVVVWRW